MKNFVIITAAAFSLFCFGMGTWKAFQPTVAPEPERLPTPSECPLEAGVGTPVISGNWKVKLTRAVLTPDRIVALMFQIRNITTNRILDNANLHFIRIEDQFGNQHNHADFHLRYSLHPGEMRTEIIHFGPTLRRDDLSFTVTIGREYFGQEIVFTVAADKITRGEK